MANAPEQNTSTADDGTEGPNRPQGIVDFADLSHEATEIFGLLEALELLSETAFCDDGSLIAMQARHGVSAVLNAAIEKARAFADTMDRVELHFRK
jgi:hypothetical protein